MVSLILSAIIIPTHLYLGFIVLMIITLFLFALAKIPAKTLIGFAKLLVTTSLILFLIQVLVFPSLTIQSLHVLFWIITYEGILYGIQTVARFLIIMFSFFLFLSTTAIDKFTIALQKIGFPRTWAFIFATSMNFLPVLSREWKIVLEAQTSRGLSFKGNIFKKLNAYLRVLGPVFTNAIVKSSDIAMAFECRALDFKKPRTERKKLKLNRFDYVFLILSAMIVTFSFFVRFFYS
jgi:energy-coupling factor transport system permease protein